ncbi:MAG: 16S rRNA (cytosine(1402)-N(4))-methyltransferase, partial [Bifidobacteriaceae bacterium]|nr:16S rRNA (cytosine(1402)-N(4))-methyltransferase [Bifidobacteriaceae bacterium]
MSNKSLCQYQHIPVLSNEIINIARVAFLNVTNPVMIDGTLGLGGHTKAMLSKFSNLKVYGFDKDIDVKLIVNQKLKEFLGRWKFIHDDFVNISQYIKSANFVLLDLGVSSMQIDNRSRGFSYMLDGQLDMRMNQRQNLDA